MQVHYLGPRGTFSEQAACRYIDALGSSAELAPQPSISAASEAAKTAGSVGILPFYNLLDGAVTDTIDAIHGGGLFGMALIRIAIQFDAACASDLAQVSTVASHPKALAQCAEFIRNMGEGVQTKAVSSTAASVELAEQEPTVLAIASPEAISGSALTRVGTDVGDKRYGIANFTEFLVVRHEQASQMGRGLLDGVILAMPLADAGSLAAMLARVEPAGFTMEKLIVRPAPGLAAQALAAPQAVLMHLRTTAQFRADMQPRVDDVLRGNWETARCVGLLDAVEAPANGPSS